MNILLAHILQYSCHVIESELGMNKLILFKPLEDNVNYTLKPQKWKKLKQIGIDSFRGKSIFIEDLLSEKQQEYKDFLTILSFIILTLM